MSEWSTTLWWALDNLPPVDGWTAGRYGRAPAMETLARAYDRHRDLETVVRDQRRYIASLEEQLLPHLVHESAEQGTLA